MEQFAFPTIIDKEDTLWFDQANCKGSDTESFFVESGDNYPPELARICKACDVKNECLAFAVKYRVQGYWGGTNEKQRKFLRFGFPVR